MASNPHDFSPFMVDWTNTGGADGQGFSERIQALEKWVRTHRGIDYNSAGPDYPHPSQKVRALYFYEGNGRLTNVGFQILATDAANPRGFYWVDEFTDSPETVSPVTLISAYIDPAAQHLDILSRSPNGLNMAGIAYIVSDSGGGQSNIRITATGADGVNDAELSIISDAASNYIGVSAPLVLASVTADFTLGIADGMLWYRSDTDKFRARIAGATQNLATESYVTAAATNHVPYVAKSADYTTTATDGLIAVDASGAARTITLITAVGNSGLQHTIKKTDSSANIVTVDANSTQTIDGALTRGIPIQYGFLTLVSDGANWLITGQG